ncbi:ABC transporter ATP-binding protein [Candidatus Bathyarchaeota archaeon]|nr:ABC transporter ATP-binding protein [Candidatus Bathyarchaeota archaeon]
MAIVCKDVVKIYKQGQIEVQALRGLEMKVEGGEMISLIGPSGSGKTTLLNIIGGLDKPSAGYVKVFDKILTLLSPKELVEFRRSTVGHVFQTMNLIPSLTAGENIELPMIALGVPKHKRRDRVNELIEVVGLKERINHKPGELSGGEQQRVALAAALANDPRLILADEPTGELDSFNARIIVDYLSKINKELGKTIIMVTHDPIVAREANRILRIQDGVIKTDLAPAELEVSGQASYIDMLQRRIAEINKQLELLDADLKKGLITGDSYVERQTNLKQTKTVLIEELHRLGVVH